MLNIVTLIDLESKTLESFVTFIKKNFNEVNLNISSANRIYNSQDLFNQDFLTESKIEYPILGYIIKQISLNSAPGSLYNWKQGVSPSSVDTKTGDKTYPDSDQMTGRVPKLTIIPVTLIVSTLLISNNYLDISKANVAYLNLGALSESFYMDIKEGEGPSIQLPMTVRINAGEVSVPEKENEGDIGAIYRIEHEYFVTSFIGFADYTALATATNLKGVSSLPNANILITNNSGVNVDAINKKAAQN